MKKRIVLLGGDLRQYYMAKSLIRKDFAISYYGLNFPQEEQGAHQCRDKDALWSALREADALILPDPVSRECAVVMMADAVEAVSRTLVDKTEENITKVVNNIIDGQLQDGRYANADITFKDIATVKKVFIEMLTNIYHSRIAYPKLKQEEKK